MSEQRKPITISTLRNMKQAGEKIAMLTAYDYSFAVQLDRAEVDVVLVGDSLGMVIQGHETTLPVTVDEIVYHTKIVQRGLSSSFLVADLPFMSYATVDQALENAARLMKEGSAQMVKLEGGQDQTAVVENLVRRNIPVCAHLGLQPQAVHQIGGYKVQGRVEKDAERMIIDAETLENAGASMLVLECVPELLAAEIAKAVEMPVIGIGAGKQCDGQVLVLQDMLGITAGRAPKFSRNFMEDAASIPEAITNYVQAVRDGSFPETIHTF